MLKTFTKGEKKILKGLKIVFPLYYDERHEHQMKAEREIEEEIKEKRRGRKEKKEKQKEQDKEPFDLDYLIELIINREKLPINNELFKKHFNLETPIFMYKVLNETKDKEKKIKLVNIFNSVLKALEKEIKEMFKEEIETKKPYNIVKVVKKILEFNKDSQKGEGIKILTPNQMLSRLPIALAQLQAGNNSNKLKNEIRQLLYSLYCSKDMTEQIYKSLIGTI